MGNAAAAAVGLPPDGAGLRVERKQVGHRAVIDQKEDGIAKQGGRTAVAPLVEERAEFRREGLCPDGLAVQVQGDGETVAEPSVDAVAVGHRSGGGEVVLLVHFRFFAGCGRAELPTLFAIGETERLNAEEYFARRASNGPFLDGERSFIARQAWVGTVGRRVGAGL